MRIIVQKFGGTSVSTPELRELVANRVHEAQQSGYSIVVVVSAMGRKGDPYATDTLLSLVEQEHPYVKMRDLDMLMACGEIVSAVMMGAVLRKRKLNACVLSGRQAGIRTTDDYTKARILGVDTAPLKGILEKGTVAVVAGFQGSTESGDITTLGRGGSDTTAVALGLALDAEKVEIYTDVAGVMTADPRIEPKAKVLQQITYQEVLQMAQKGAKVIHPRAVELAMQHKLPLYVTTTVGKAAGTTISELSFSQKKFEAEGTQPVTAVAHLGGLVQFRIPPLSLNAARKLYQELAIAGVSLDLINIGTENHMFVVTKQEAIKSKKICQDLGLKPTIVEDVAKISAIGAGMHGLPGVLSGIVMALTNRNIEILQTSDSHLTISCLVKGQDMCEAVKSLHEYFDLERM